MKTLKFATARQSQPALWLLLLLSGASALVHAQEAVAQTDDEKPQIIRPERSDGTSKKLISNYLAASGGAAKHRLLRNVKVTGEYKEAKDLKYFTLVETDTGQRYLKLHWKLRGIEYEQIYAYDGVETWQHRPIPDDGKRNLPKSYKGRSGIHFAHQRWFFHPFNLPLSAKYVFEYQGTDEVAERSSYMVVGYGPKDERTWFYFDQQTFLVTRWGGIGPVSGGQAYLDYQAKGFRPVDGIFLPTGLIMLAKGQPYGEISFKTIETNVAIEEDLFTKPTVTIPTLRQVPVQ